MATKKAKEVIAPEEPEEVITLPDPDSEAGRADRPLTARQFIAAVIENQVDLDKPIEILVFPKDQNIAYTFHAHHATTDPEDSTVALAIGHAFDAM